MFDISTDLMYPRGDHSKAPTSVDVYIGSKRYNIPLKKCKEREERYNKMVNETLNGIPDTEYYLVPELREKLNDLYNHYFKN